MPYRTCKDCGSREHVRCYKKGVKNMDQFSINREVGKYLLTRDRLNDDRIKELESAVHELQKRLDRQEIMILRQGMPLE